MTSMARVALEPAFVLHTRQYRNSSLIVEMFTMRHGRVAAVARSARGPKSRYRGRIQPFAPILASWVGRSELKSMGTVESNGRSYVLEGSPLLCGFYLNELMMRLVGHEDPFPSLYERYQNTLNSLEQGGVFEAHLRYFEKHLLQDLGYGLSFSRDLTHGDIDPNGFYRYMSDRGFHQADPNDDVALFPGSMLLALKNETLETPEDLRFAKRLMRMALSPYLGKRPIHTRALL